MKENAQMLFRMETQTFNRTFDCPSRNKEETMSYLKNAKTYFAYQGSNVVGVFSYYESKDNIEIKLFFVLNEHQGKGFGIEMMSDLAQRKKLGGLISPAHQLTEEKVACVRDTAASLLRIGPARKKVPPQCRGAEPRHRPTLVRQ